MKVLCLLGSARHDGNSSTIAKKICEVLGGEAGAQITVHHLYDLNFKGCSGCRQCKSAAESCVLKDDITEILNSFRDADIVIMATPVYFGDIASSLKAFIERTYSFLPQDYSNNQGSRLARGKRLVLVVTQGDPKKAHFSDIYPKYQFFLESHFSKIFSIRGCGLIDKSSASNNYKLMKEAEKTAKRVL